MRGLYALQHCDSEFLGLIEDHLEGRGIRFQYIRPFTAGGRVPGTAFHADGLIVMGGGAWGTVGARIVPTLDSELRLIRDFLARRRPVIAWGLGAQLLCLAAGGGAEPGPLTASVQHAARVGDDALGGYLPARYPLVTFMRDRPMPPAGARVLALDPAGRPAAFQIGANALGFVGHPGMKPAVAEDLVMEFDDALVDGDGNPIEPASFLEAVRASQGEIADALVSIMTGIVRLTGLMQPITADEQKRRQTIPITR